MPSLQLAKFNLKEKKISLPEFVKITKTVIKLMNEAIKCMEDFDLDSTGNGNYGNTGCGVFKRGVQNQKVFCLRINILKGSY